MISVVILAHNDEKIIVRCLSSLSWCDEIVLIDDMSSDGTAILAKKMGANVFKRRLDGDFASQRNFGLSKAKSEWVLFIDSDEVVPEDLKNEIEKAIQNSSYHGYYLKRNDFFLGRWLMHGETAHTNLLRLAKKRDGKWIRPVHEIWNIQGACGRLQTPIQHYPHPTISEFLMEINRYSSLNAKVFYDEKTPVHAYHIIFYPLAKFLYNYIFRCGFLDEVPGIILSLMMSFHSFLTRAKLYVLSKSKK